VRRDRDELSALLAGAGIPASGPDDILVTAGGSAAGIRTRGADALARWEAIRGAVPVTGLWPVIIGEEGDDPLFLGLADGWDRGSADREAAVAEASGMDAGEWLRSRRAAQVEDLDLSPDEHEEYEASMHGDWPDLPPHDELQAPLATRSSYRESVTIILVPVDAGWKVPIWFDYGGWNECPDPVEHAVVLRAWSERFGAELAAACRDTLELRVLRPVDSRQTAVDVAFEQVCYCPDVIDQPGPSLEARAATLLGGRIWTFWWD
jgi:hypothetical protein